MIRLLKDEECLNYLSDLLFKHLTTTFFFADLIIFRTNINTSFYLAVPIFFAVSAFNNRTRFRIMQENEIGICTSEGGTVWASWAMFFPIYLPLLFAVYLTALNELRLF
jgi:hypothetical protein